MLMADVCKPLAPVTPPIFHEELEASCLRSSASGLLVSWTMLGTHLAP